MLINDKENSFKQRLVTKVGGKKLTTMNLGGKVSYNFYTEVKRDGKGGGDYNFLTQSDGINEARSTYGVFDDYRIPNNLKLIVDTIREKDLGLKK